MNKFNKVSGIYKIVNRITGSFYIGSSKNIYTRMSGHLYLLRKNKHHSYILQNQFNKYGEDSLYMTPICFCDESLLLILEQMYLDSMNPPCNIMNEVGISPMKGKTHSEEVLVKMRGKVPWNKGKERSTEEKILMSERRKLAYLRQSNQTKQKNKERSSHFLKTNKPFKGKSHSPERKLLIRKHRISNRKKFICDQTGVIYEAQLDAAKDLNIRQGHISEHLQGKRNEVKGYTFTYLDESNEEYISSRDLKYGHK